MKSQWKKACTYWNQNKDQHYEENSSITELEHLDSNATLTSTTAGTENMDVLHRDCTDESNQDPVDLSSSSKILDETVEEEANCTENVENVSSLTRFSSNLTGNIAWLSNQIQIEMDTLCNINYNDSCHNIWKCIYCPFLGESPDLLHSHYQYHQILLASHSSLAHIEWLSAYRTTQEAQTKNDSYQSSAFLTKTLTNSIDNPCSEIRTSCGPAENISSNQMPTLPPRYYATRQPQSASGFLKKFVKAVMQQDNTSSEALTSSVIYSSMLNPENNHSKVYKENEAESITDYSMKNNVVESENKRKYESDDTDEENFSTSSSDIDSSSNDAPAVEDSSKISSNSLEMIQNHSRNLYKKKLEENLHAIKDDKNQSYKKQSTETNYSISLHNKSKNISPEQSIQYSMMCSQYGNNYQMDNTPSIQCSDKSSYLPIVNENAKNAHSHEPITPINVLPQDNIPDRIHDSRLISEHCSVEYSNKVLIDHIKVKKECTSDVKQITFENKMTQYDLKDVDSPLKIEKIKDNEKSSSPLNSNKYCPHCMITFNDEVLFSIHIGVHSHKKPFDCNLCGESYENRYTFYTHLIRGHFSV